MPWIDTATGDTVDKDADGELVWFEPFELPQEPPVPFAGDPADAEHAEGWDDWVPDWLGLELAKIRTEEAAAKKQYERGLRRRMARERYLNRFYLGRAESVVERDLAKQKGKKKSVDYEHTRAGWRTSKRIEVANEDLAIAHCLEHGYDDAVNIRYSLRKTACKDLDVPGVSTVEQTKFYVRAG